MEVHCDVIVVGSGNAALCAALAALESGQSVVMLEKARPEMAGGNSKYTAGAMRFVYDGSEDILPLVEDRVDVRPNSDFGAYTERDFTADLLRFNGGRPLSEEQKTLISESYSTVLWLSGHGVRFTPLYAHQSTFKDGRHVFWGGLTLGAVDEGVGLVRAELEAFTRLGGIIRHNCPVRGLIVEDGRVVGVKTPKGNLRGKAVVLACGGFEANPEMRAANIGPIWERAKVRGTPYNTGDGLQMAYDLGARKHGLYGGCHSAPMDYTMPEYGNLEIPHQDRKLYRKICYFLGIMVNSQGKRFVDEGLDLRNYTYAQFGKAIMDQPDCRAWQIFDSKVVDDLHKDYHFFDASYVEDASIEGLVDRLEGVTDKPALLRTIREYNQAVDGSVTIDLSIKDGRGTRDLEPPKSNWAQTIDRGPFRAYPVTGGITFTYGGLMVDADGAVVHDDGHAIPGLYAAGEIVGGVFFDGYPGGSGLTSGAIFGRRAGKGAAAYAVLTS